MGLFTQFFLLHSETRKNLIATSVDAYSELEIRSVIAKSFEMSMIWSEGHVGLISKLLYPEVDGSAFASAQIDINDFMSDCAPYYKKKKHHTKKQNDSIFRCVSLVCLIYISI